MATGQHAVYHSGHLLMQAKRAYERSLSQSWDAMSCIMLSAFALECFLNELEERLEHPYLMGSGRLQTLKDTLSLLEERAPVLTRIDALHLVLLGARIQRGAQPFQDLQFLNALRNALVHRRPERFDWEIGDKTKEYEPHKFVAYLVQRQIISKPNPGEPPSWSQYVLVPEVAKWAHDTVVAFVRTIASWLPTGTLKESTEFLIRDWKPIAI